MKKVLLLTPGPTPVPDRVRLASLNTTLHHRTHAFKQIFESIRHRLKQIFVTQSEVIVLSATGTGAMEAAIVNLFKPQDRVLVINGGKFGARFVKLAQTYGLNVIDFYVPRGESLDFSALESVARSESIKAILFQATETSTGTTYPVKKIAELCQSLGILSLCDAITALGVFPISMDAWGLDCVISGSQKAFMVPPGLSFIALSERAWKNLSSTPKFYFDLQAERKAHLLNQTAWSPAISLILGLDEGLKMIEEEGLEQRFRRHRILAEATRKAITALGLKVFSSSPSDALTAILPLSLSPQVIVKRMQEDHGVILAEGQDELKDQIFRISHFGYIFSHDLLAGLSALELTLQSLGHELSSGISLQAFQSVIAEERI